MRRAGPLSAIRGIAVVVFLLLRVDSAAAQKTDVVELANGDRITCEITRLDRGKLTAKTDGIGTIGIEWNDVKSVVSTATFDIELTTGQRVFGSLVRGDAGTVSVVTTKGSEQFPLGSVVAMSRLGGSFWRRLDGAVDAGFSFTQADLQTQYTLSTSVSYRGAKWESALDVDSLMTIRDNADSQTRNSLTLQAQRFLRPRWSAVGVAQFQQNEELSLELRASFAGGIQRTVVQSNRTALDLVGGFAGTQERYKATESETVAEAVAGGRWGWFTFDGRSTNLDVSAFTFYALNRDARVRLELSTTFKSDIVGDLYWSVNLYESYNSDPPTDEKSNDASISASVGWSF